MKELSNKLTIISAAVFTNMMPHYFASKFADAVFVKVRFWQNPATFFARPHAVNCFGRIKTAVPTFVNFIAHIIKWRTQKQMRYVYAKRCVAPVAYIQAIRHRAVYSNPCPFMDTHFFTVIFANRITPLIGFAIQLFVNDAASRHFAIITQELKPSHLPL
jgi:hypothetical protein